MALPARFDREACARSAETAELGVRAELTLTKGSRYVEVRTSVENRSRDHYLKVCFPTGLRAETTCADGSFCVTEYPVNPDLTCELARHPAQMWFDVSDGAGGLAVLSRSTKDYEVLDENGKATLAMGLLRSVRLRIPCDNRLWMEYPGDESSQALGTTVHSYAVLPHAGKWDEARLHEDAVRFRQPMKCCQFGRQAGRLPTKMSFLRVSGPGLVLSAVKKAESRDSVLVRLFNPTGETVSAVLDVGFPFRKAHTVKLSEERVRELPPARPKPLRRGEGPSDGRRITLAVGKGKIVTVELERGE
jgi:alpha-mannosidase